MYFKNLYIILLQILLLVLLKVVYMMNIIEYLNDYENVADEIKFVSNSIIRLKLLAALKYGCYTMKELSKKAKLSYCSLSTNANFLELNNWVFKKDKKYSLTPIMKLYLDNLLEVDRTIEITQNFKSFFNGHDVSSISIKSIDELYLLEKSKLIESNLNEILKSQLIIESSLNEAEYVNAIFPYSYTGFPDILNHIIEKGTEMEVLIHNKIFFSILKEINFESNNFNFNTFDLDSSFLLIVTDKIFILGLYFEDGSFDQQRLLVSKSKNSIKWGENLFKNFKEENYLKYSSK